MDKKLKFGAFVTETRKKTKSLLDSAIQSADRNDDGIFDFSDVSFIAETMGVAVKKGTLAVKEGAEERARLLELKTLQPIFPAPVEYAASLDDSDFLMPKFIRITDRDKKHAESEVCKGSIGYASDQKGLHIVNIFRDSIEVFGLTFYPDSDGEFYYVDPSDRDHYIALDDYFSYLKIVRINELKKIAQDLGAKHFRVTYKEEQTTFSSKNTKGSVKISAIASADATQSSSEKKYSRVEIASEMSFPGHPPVKPQLKYLQRDPSIQTLVSMRMDETAPLISEKYVLKLSQSSGMKEADAVKIDAVLKGLKCSGNATVTSEVQNESRRYLEYDIMF